MKRLLLLAAVAGLSACRFPPFDAGLSLARVTTARLDALGTMGPYRGVDDTPGHYTLVPERDILQGGALRGWVAQVGTGFVRLRYSTGGSSISQGEWGRGFPADPATPPPVLRALAPESLVVIVFGYPGAPVSLLQHSAGSINEPSPGTLDGFLGSAFADAGPEVDGAEALPLPVGVPQQAEMHFLRPDMSLNGSYREVWATIDATSVSFTAPGESSQAVSGLPGPPARSFFYHYGPLYSYASLMGSSGGWATYRWDRAGSPAWTLALRRRIDAVLSNGWLFSRDSSDGYVFDADGRSLATFPMGSLRFAGECWDTAEARFRMVFVLPLITGGADGGERELDLEVYSWPTSKVASLE